PLIGKLLPGRRRDTGFNGLDNLQGRAIGSTGGAGVFGAKAGLGHGGGCSHTPETSTPAREGQLDVKVRRGWGATPEFSQGSRQPSTGDSFSASAGPHEPGA